MHATALGKKIVDPAYLVKRLFYKNPNMFPKLCCIYFTSPGLQPCTFTLSLKKLAFLKATRNRKTKITVITKHPESSKHSPEQRRPGRIKGAMDPLMHEVFLPIR